MRQRVREIGSVLVGIGAMSIALLLVWVLVSTYNLADQIRETQQKGSPLLKAVASSVEQAKSAAKEAKAANDQLADCLTPGGDCYKRGQKNTADVVGSINEITYYAVACADMRGQQSLEEIQGCVIQRLARSHQR